MSPSPDPPRRVARGRSAWRVPPSPGRPPDGPRCAARDRADPGRGSTRPASPRRGTWPGTRLPTSAGCPGPGGKHPGPSVHAWPRGPRAAPPGRAPTANRRSKLTLVHPRRGRPFAEQASDRGPLYILDPRPGRHKVALPFAATRKGSSGSILHRGRRPIDLSLQSPKNRGNRPRLGSGNDSVRNGPLSSRFLHNDFPGRFAFYLETRTRRLTQRRATNPLRSLTRPVFQPFLRLSSLVARPRRRRTEVGFAARLRTPLSSSAEWVRWLVAPLGPSLRAGLVPHKVMRTQTLGSEWPILSRIVAIPRFTMSEN